MSSVNGTPQSGQTPLPDVEGLEPPPSPSTCLWCSQPPTETVEVEPAKWTTTGGVRRVARAAITALACAGCARRLEARKAQLEAERAAERKRKRTA